MKLPPLILASASPRRAELLRQINATFTVVPSHATEIHDDQLTAREVTQINACRKAHSIAKQHPDALVLGADTLVYLGTTLFGKPGDLEEAYRMLKLLSGKTHEVVTAVCLIHLRKHRQKAFADVTSVKFRSLTSTKIRRYLARVNPLDKAGAYAIQEDCDLIVEGITGSYTNVVGLPVESLRAELNSWK